MKLTLSTVISLFLATTALAIPSPKAPKPTNYDGAKVVRITLDDTAQQAAKVAKLVKDLNLEVWTHEAAIKPLHTVDIQVDKEKLDAFHQKLEGIQYLTMHEDLGAAIRAESAGSSSVNAFADGTSSIAAADQSWFNAYHSYAEHITYLNDLVRKFPANSKIVTAGTSYEGRPITGVHIFGSSGGGQRPAAIFHGTVHAREWITTMVSEYTAYQLLNNYANSTEVKGYVDKYDFYIFPIVNPDGFVYTQTTSRLWRKNRQPGTSCVGTDINRNWNSNWALTGGASTNPCDETYKGTSAGSTPEFKALSAFNNARQSAQGVKFFMDYHAYSQLWMSPYGYSCTKLPTDNTELNRVSRGAVAAIRAVYGTSYEYGPICSTIYQATGTSVDYTYDVTKVKYSYTAELRDKGASGFLLPANQIRPTGEEMWAGIKYVLGAMV